MWKRAFPAALIVLAACADDPVAPSLPPLEPRTTPSNVLILTTPGNTMLESYFGSGIDPTGRYVVGHLGYNQGYAPLRWAFQLPGYEGLDHDPAIAGFTHWGRFVTTAEGFVAATAYTISGCQAFFWWDGQRRPIATGTDSCFEITDVARRGESFWVLGNAGGRGRLIRFLFPSTGSGYSQHVLTLQPPAGLAPPYTIRAQALRESSSEIIGSYYDHATGGPPHVISWASPADAASDWGITGDPRGVNRDGVVVGVDQPAGFISIGPGNKTLVMAPGASSTELYDISNNGTIIGYADITPTGGGIALRNGQFAYREGAMLHAISNNGVIVGTRTNYEDPFNGTVLFGIALDRDNDTAPNDVDNCPSRYNPDQLDTDVDGIGDWCDPDSPPVIVAPDTPATRYEGREYTLRLEHVFDPGRRGVSGSWAFSDGVVLNGLSVTRSFDDDSPFHHAVVTVSNGVTSSADTIPLPVLNRAPTIRIEPYDSIVGAGETMVLQLTLSDRGTDNIFYSVIWEGDQQPDFPTFACAGGGTACEVFLTHVFDTPGRYRVSILVQDSDNAYRGMTVPIRVE